MPRLVFIPVSSFNKLQEKLFCEQLRTVFFSFFRRFKKVRVPKLTVFQIPFPSKYFHPWLDRRRNKRTKRFPTWKKGKGIEKKPINFVSFSHYRCWVRSLYGILIFLKCYGWQYRYYSVRPFAYDEKRHVSHRRKNSSRAQTYCEKKSTYLSRIECLYVSSAKAPHSGWVMKNVIDLFQAIWIQESLYEEKNGKHINFLLIYILSSFRIPSRKISG